MKGTRKSRKHWKRTFRRLEQMRINAKNFRGRHDYYSIVGAARLRAEETKPRDGRMRLAAAVFLFGSVGLGERSPNPRIRFT